MVHDDHAVARQMDVELQAVSAERDAVIERREGVLRAQAPNRRDARTPAARPKLEAG